MLKKLSWLPPTLTATALKKVRDAGYSREKPPPRGAFIPFVTGFTDGACRGGGLHSAMDVCPGTTIPQMVQLMHAVAPISIWDGVAGVTMAPDQYLRGPHDPPNGKFDPHVIRTQWLPFLWFLTPDIAVQNLVEIVRPEWYPFVGGLDGDYPSSLPEGFVVDAVVQTTSREDFGNLIIVSNVAAGPLADLPAALGPELVVCMNGQGHSNTIIFVGSNNEGLIPSVAPIGGKRLYVDEPLEKVVGAVMDVWDPDGMPQPSYRAVTGPTAVSADAGASLLDVFRTGAWKQLGDPQRLDDARLLQETRVRGTLYVISRQPCEGVAILTNGVSRPPDMPAIPYHLLPRQQL